MTACNIVARDIHKRMCNDQRFGYSWAERWGAGKETWNVDGRRVIIGVGDYDCSSSTITAWRLALVGTKYEGALDAATYTGNMRSVFVGSGLFEWKPMSFLAAPGDLYLNETNHVAMCQTQTPDILSEFSSNEYGGAYGGQRGDQTGWESHITGYYDYPWNGILHYNGKADTKEKIVPKQPTTKPKNNAGVRYFAHVQNVGDLPKVRDGQTAGTEGYGVQLEAVTIYGLPKGWEVEAQAHIKNKGWRKFAGIKDGVTCLIGTKGERLRLEALGFRVTKRPVGDNRRLYFQVHQACYGWKAKTPEGYFSGSDGEEMQLEAVRIWIE